MRTSSSGHPWCSQLWGIAVSHCTKAAVLPLSVAIIVGAVIGGGGGGLCFCAIVAGCFCAHRHYALVPRGAIVKSTPSPGKNGSGTLAAIPPRRRAPSLDELAPGVKRGKARLKIERWDLTPWAASGGFVDGARATHPARGAGTLGAVSDGRVDVDARSPQTPQSAAVRAAGSPEKATPAIPPGRTTIIPPTQIWEDSPASHALSSSRQQLD